MLKDWILVEFSMHVLEQQNIAVHPNMLTGGYKKVYVAQAEGPDRYDLVIIHAKEFSREELIAYIRFASNTNRNLAILFHQIHHDVVTEIIETLLQVSPQPVNKSELNLALLSPLEGIKNTASQTLELEDIQIVEVYKLADEKSSQGDTETMPQKTNNVELDLTYRKAWRSERARRLIILSTLFPNANDLIRSLMPDIILQNELDQIAPMTNCFSEDGSKTKPAINSPELEENIKQFIQSELCVDESVASKSRRGDANAPLNLENLTKRIKTILSYDNLTEYKLELFDGEDAFFSDRFLGKKITPVDRENHESEFDIYVAEHDTRWQMILGIPRKVRQGQFDNTKEVKVFNSEADIQKRMSIAQHGKIIIAPTFSANVIKVCSELGVYMVDWVGITFMRKLALEGKSINPEKLDDFSRAFIGASTALVWDYNRLVPHVN